MHKNQGHIFIIWASHRHPFEEKQPIMNWIHRVEVVLKLQLQSRSRDEQTIEIYHSPPAVQEAITSDKIF